MNSNQYSGNNQNYWQTNTEGYVEFRRGQSGLPSFCPFCGNAVGASASFCAYCGHRLPDNRTPPTKHRRKKKSDGLILIFAIAASLALIGILTFVFVTRQKSTEKSVGRPSTEMMTAQSEFAPETTSASVEPTRAPVETTNEAAPDSLCGTWFCYEWENRKEQTVIQCELRLSPTLEASVTYSAELSHMSDYYESHSGRWAASVLTSGDIRIELFLEQDGSYYDDEGALKNARYECIDVHLEGNNMFVVSTEEGSGEFAGRSFRAEPYFGEWLRQEGVTKDKLQLQLVSTLYQEFFNDNFPTSYAGETRSAIVDVVDNGCFDLLVVRIPDTYEEAITGYIYTLDASNKVKLVYQKSGYEIHAMGYFEWFIQENETTPTTYVLATMDGYWGMGLGELTFRTYYITEDGEEHTVDSVSVRSNDYTSSGEIDNAYNQFEIQVAEMKSRMYTLYNAVCVDGFYDEDTIGSFFSDEPFMMKNYGRTELGIPEKPSKIV